MLTIRTSPRGSEHDMPRYIVRWEIEVEADTPEDAAFEALVIQRDPDRTGTCSFDVRDPMTGERQTIDLTPEEEEPDPSACKHKWVEQGRRRYCELCGDWQAD